MKRLLPLLLFLIAAPTALADTAPREDEGADRSVGHVYLYNFVRVPGHVLGELVRTDREGLTRNLAGLAAVGLAYHYDQEIRDWSQERRTDDSDRVSGYLYDVGTPRTAGIALGLGYGYSWFADDPYTRDTMHLAFQSLAVSAVFTTAAKVGVRRIRPRHSPDDPTATGDSGDQSFFSGHASGSWAFLTVVAERHAHNRPLYWGSYGLASAVALSRVHDDGHWMSDIVAGSLVGYAVGQATVRLSPFKGRDAAVLPLVSSDSVGLQLHVSLP